jgi:hypothetical protein
VLVSRIPVALAAAEVVCSAAQAVFVVDLVGVDLCPDLCLAVDDPRVVGSLGEAEHKGNKGNKDNKGIRSEAVYRCGRSA